MFFDVAIFSFSFLTMIFSLHWSFFFSLLSQNSINDDVNTNLFKIHKRILAKFYSVHSNQSRSFMLFSVSEVQKRSELNFIRNDVTLFCPIPKALCQLYQRQSIVCTLFDCVLHFFLSLSLLKCDLLSSWHTVHCRWNQKMNVNHTQWIGFRKYGIKVQWT